MTSADAIRAAELAEAETAYRLQLARESYQAGLEAGYKRGYETGAGQREAGHASWWRDHGQHLVNQPSRAELEERRWGPGGRAHFADPRPGDYPGRRVQAEREAAAEAAIEELEITA